MRNRSLIALSISLTAAMACSSSSDGNNDGRGVLDPSGTPSSSESPTGMPTTGMPSTGTPTTGNPTTGTPTTSTPTNTSGAGGAPGASGTAGAAGTPGASGTPGAGGEPAAGGMSGAGGEPAAGGMSGAGGEPAAGGMSGAGGEPSAGGGPEMGDGGMGGTPSMGGDGGSGGGEGGGDADVRPSAGCDNANGVMTLTAGGMSVAGALPTSTRVQASGYDFIVDIPEDYDPAHPYRLIFSWYQAYGSNTGNATGQHPAGDGPNFDAANYAFFGLHRQAMMANDPVIFVAPSGEGNLPWEFNRDSAKFDELLALVDENLCIDDSRVFTTGFSFGAMMSHALSISRQSKLRAAVTMAPANYALPGMPTPNGEPIGYFGITGMSDTTCPWVNDDGRKEGGKYAVLEHAEANGCTIPDSIPTESIGSRNHTCYEFEGCNDGYPVKVCTFDGPHTPSAVCDGNTNGDDGRNAFVPPLAWEFISQF